METNELRGGHSSLNHEKKAAKEALNLPICRAFQKVQTAQTSVLTPGIGASYRPSAFGRTGGSLSSVSASWFS